VSGKAPSHAGEICLFNPTSSMDSTNSTDYSPELPVIDLKEKLHKIALDIFKGTPVIFAYLYGSYAGGVPHRFSDLDIGIFVEELVLPTCLDLELSLALRIDELLDHVVQSEVRVINYLPLVVNGKILSDGELIYSIAENKRIDFEGRVRRAYFDFLPVIQEYQKTYRDNALSVSGNGLS